VSELAVPAVAQLDPASGPPLAVVGTFLLATAFYALTAHIAARYVLGSVPIRPAAGVGVVLAGVALVLRSFGPATVIAVSLAADVAAINRLYGVDWRPTLLVAVVHYTVSALLGLTLFNLLRLLATAPL
jgi:hypothetical protein